jgi:hypothetical protein
MSQYRPNELFIDQTAEIIEEGKIPALARVVEYRTQVDALKLELAEERRPKDAADERARKAEGKIVRLEQQLAKQTQEANKYRSMVDDFVEDLNGDLVETLQDRVRIAEEDRQLGWERCNILQRNTDTAKRRSWNTTGNCLIFRLISPNFSA